MNIQYSLVNDYFRDIRDIPLLSAEEERGLAVAARRGHAEAKERLVVANLWLVVKIARSYVGFGMPFEDLVGEGNVGLLKAVNLFDPHFGTRLSTYADWWIRQAIREAFVNTSHTIRLPQHMARLLRKFHRTKQALRQSTGRVPTVDEVAGAMGLSDRQKQFLLKAQVARRAMVSSSSHGDLGDRFLGSLADERQTAEEDQVARDECEAVMRRMTRLDQYEREVITYRFGLGDKAPMSLGEIGKLMGISKQGVHYIEARAKSKLGMAHATAAWTQRTNNDHTSLSQ
jgi:RNA polymerase primary sigma factor